MEVVTFSPGAGEVGVGVAVEIRSRGEGGVNRSRYGHSGSFPLYA